MLTRTRAPGLQEAVKCTPGTKQDFMPMAAAGSIIVQSIQVNVVDKVRAWLDRWSEGWTATNHRR